MFLPTDKGKPVSFFFQRGNIIQYIRKQKKITVVYSVSFHVVLVLNLVNWLCVNIHQLSCRMWLFCKFLAYLVANTTFEYL